MPPPGTVVPASEMPTDADTMTLFVHPLTGKIKILSGVKTLRMPVAGDDNSEREDRGPF
jgi:hypothetical protein